MDLNNLSDNELRQQLIALGQSVGPLTPSTRTFYVKKLKNLLRKQGNAPINSPTQFLWKYKLNILNILTARCAQIIAGSEFFQETCSFAFKPYNDGSSQNSCIEPPIRMDDRAPTSTRKRRLVNRVTKANQDQALCNTFIIPRIPLSQVDDLDSTLLGEGTFGRVIKCKYLDNSDLQWKDVAIKYASSAYRRCALVREAKIFYTYLKTHKNCIKFFGLHNSPLNGMGIVMELMDCSLAWLISKQSIKYEVDHAISWLYQLSDAMSFFHSKEQVHRDLKLQNLLLCNGFHTLKVCDFGTYTTLHDSMTMEKGTLITMAPEVIRASKYYDEKCDIYSFGIIMWQIIARRLSPYQQERYYVILNVAENILRPPELSCDPLLSRFYKACWDDDPDVRPNSEQVKQYFAVLKKAFPNGNYDLTDTSTNRPAVGPRSMENVCPNPENIGAGDVKGTQNENTARDPPVGFLRPYLRYLDRRRNPWDPQDPFLLNPVLFVQRLFSTMEWCVCKIKGFCNCRTSSQDCDVRILHAQVVGITDYTFPARCTSRLGGCAVPEPLKSGSSRETPEDML
ncbi:unnamed protein product [Cylicocyclus nassatus]|uniref:Mitogen-activated protein kinase kinase kinase n=1 Tax=Cylicocyclus nassatus TaxID=53992 RepID=A0AA36DWD5_CYLNA|nr:unnamed protein product [Cylicocyclus nassatus]